MKSLKLITTIVAIGTMLAACSDKEPAKSPSVGAGSPDASQSSTTSYPLQTDQTLSYWSEMTGNLTGVKSKLDEVPFYQEWQKKTGVKVAFTSPPANQVKENFNVMLASGELPDLIEFNFLKEFPGGPEKAIKDGYILELNDLIDKHAPNLKKFLKENPQIDKMVKTDKGSYYVFPFIRGDDYLTVFQGPIIRKDWLDELGLPVPATIDEWTTVLKAFKEKKGVAAPLTFKSKPTRIFNELDNGGFVGAFGVTRDFYLENGQIKFGPMEKGFIDFLALFRSWYADGLLDKNVATADVKALDAAMTSSASGATVGNTGGGIGKWQPILAEQNPKAQLVAAPYPVLNKGDIPKFGQKDFPYSGQQSVAISGNSKNAELAVKMLDYGYSEEGRMLHNFGIPGVSYNLENGYPKYTDLLMKNPDKLAPAQAMSLYIRGNYGGPFIQDKRYIEQYAALPAQREAITTWAKTDVSKYKLPPITPTPEESSEYAKIMTDVNTLVDEMTLKIILGTEPLDSFQKYVDKMKSLKIDRAIEIQKAALDRYNQR